MIRITNSEFKALQKLLSDQASEIRRLRKIINWYKRGGKKMARNYDTSSEVVTNETGAVEHERVAQPEINLGREREYEIGRDEAWSSHILETSRRNTVHFDKLLVDERAHDHELRNLSVQAMQNAVETANMVSKQAVRHSDLAIDRQWNVDEQGFTVADILKAAGGETTAQKAISADIVALIDVLVEKLRAS